MLIRRKHHLRAIHIGRNNRRFVAVRAYDVVNQLVVVGDITRQHGRHILKRVVRFHVRRAHNKNRIRRRMRLVERILRELFGVIPNALGNFDVVTALNCAFVPVFLQLAHDIKLLFTHCLTQTVGLSSRKTAHLHRHQHNLLLIHHRAIRFFKN